MGISFEEAKNRLEVPAGKTYILMNQNKEIMTFNLDTAEKTVLSNDLLPYALKDFVQDTKGLDVTTVINQSFVLRDWLCSRVLPLSRENAKAILNSSGLPQVNNTQERLKIVVACKGLSILDNYWIKESGESIRFEDINLREVPLHEVLVDISLSGRCISVSAEVLRNDITTNGMFAKVWQRKDGKLKLYKSDRTIDKVNTRAELTCSLILDSVGVNHIRYEKAILNDSLCAVCDCFTSTEKTFVSAQEVRDWCYHVGLDWKSFIMQDAYREDIANMCVVDYVLANTDRHLENFGFMVDSQNNLQCLAPLYDFNQALIADEFDTNIDNLVYSLFGESIWDTTKVLAQYSTIDFDKATLMNKCQEIWIKIKDLK